MENDLVERTLDFMSEFSMPLTRFCERIEISTSAWYRFKAGSLALAEDTRKRIDEYLRKYDF